MSDEQLARAYIHHRQDYDPDNDKGYDEGPYIVDAIFARCDGNVERYKEWTITHGLAETLCEGVPYTVAI